MKKLMVPLMILSVSMFVFAGCGGKDEKKADEKKVDEKKDAGSTLKDQPEKNQQAGQQDDEGTHNVAKPPIDEKPMTPADEQPVIPGDEEQPAVNLPLDDVEIENPLDAIEERPTVPAPQGDDPFGESPEGPAEASPEPAPAIEGDDPFGEATEGPAEASPEPAPAVESDDPFGEAPAEEAPAEEAPAEEAPAEEVKENIGDLFGEETE